jgi:hypothetical protein
VSPELISAKVMILRGPDQLQDDYICAEYSHSNHGVSQTLECGIKLSLDSLFKRRAFIKPDVSLWRNHVDLIDSVRLVLYSAGGGGDTTLSYHVNRLLVDAAYGDSSSQHCPTESPGLVYTAYRCLCESHIGDACSVDSTAWYQEGCDGVGTDYAAESSDSFTIGCIISDSARVILTDDFRWFCEHPDSNFGWAFRSGIDDPGGNYRVLISAESSYDGGIYAPRLEVYYTPKRAALVLNDTSSSAAIGVDSILYLAMCDDLDYEVDYMTDDDVVSYGHAYFDTAYDVVVWAGEEVAAVSPSSNSATLQESSVGWVSMYRWTYDEANLGIGEAVLQDAGYLVVNRDHWITRVLQGTILMFMDESIVTANYRFAPDSAHGIEPLIVDEDYSSQYDYVTMCAADVGDTVYNGDVLAGRRVFLGLYHANVSQRDSCQFFTIFNRAVAWAAGDTNNYYVTHNACFSGWMEVEDSWCENASGSDSLQSYGAWGSLYTGYDYDEKVTLMKINNDAMQRKLPYDSVAVDEFTVRTKVKQVSNDPEDSLWQQTNGIRLIRLLWKCGRELGSANSDFVSWTYRYIEPPDSFVWNIGGAHGLGTDVLEPVLDSIQQNRNNTASDSVFLWTVSPEFATTMIGDTTQNHGWVWHNFYTIQQDQLNDAEILYYSSDVGDPRDKPLITVRLSDIIQTLPPVTCRPRYPVIGPGLIGD